MHSYLSYGSAPHTMKSQILNMNAHSLLELLHSQWVTLMLVWQVEGKEHTQIYHAKIRDEKGKETTSSAERHFCGLCGTHLWLFR